MKKIFYSLGCLALMLFTLTAMKLLRQDKTAPLFLQKEALQRLDENMVSYKSTLEKPTDLPERSTAFPGFKEVEITEGQRVLYLALSNPEFNTANLQYIVTLDDSSEVLLKTDLIQPGKAVTELDLPNIALGEHQINLEIQAYENDQNQTRLSGVSTSFRLKVIKKESGEVKNEDE